MVIFNWLKSEADSIILSWYVLQNINKIHTLELLQKKKIHKNLKK